MNHHRTDQQPQTAASARQFCACQDGFTMIELMVVVAIVAVLASLAAPSFRDMVEGYRVRQAVEEMTSTIYFARSEAIKRGGNVSVRRNCTTGDNDDWDCGWIVFTDADNSGTLNGADVILQTFPVLNNMNVVNIGGGAFFRVNRWGQPNSLGAASFAINPKPAGVSSRHASALCMSSGGRVRVEKNTATCA
ncbi:GspH/FimT family pseudopilin [Acidovorax sp.]|uniref:GspH/FimT family pseudopilin n=1 Tax=Acidovorax sp. TaxID=1872122 RepID=UPI00391B54E3